VQLARARFAVLQIQAAEKSIQAPIAIPQDVQELALGPDAIMRSANPQGIRRVPLELPPGVFTESGVLERELRLGSRYPEVRSGNVDASIITGRGVQALQAGFDTQVRAAQAQFARLFTELVSLCFDCWRIWCRCSLRHYVWYESKQCHHCLTTDAKRQTRIKRLCTQRNSYGVKCHSRRAACGY
jgi:hypothetical protein